MNNQTTSSTELRNEVERILRENMSHRELQTYPELTDSMIDQLTELAVTQYTKGGEAGYEQGHREALAGGDKSQ